MITIEFETTTLFIAGGQKALVNALEGCEDSREKGAEAFENANVCEKDIVIGISAAGRAPFVLSFMEKAQMILEEYGWDIKAAIKSKANK